jgi:hypothetical protein
VLRYVQDKELEARGVNGEREPDNRVPDPGQAAPVAISEKRPTKPEKPATEERLNAAEKKIEERMSAFERSTIRLTRMAIGVSIVVGLAVCAQWWEMHQGGIDTHNLADAAAKTEKSAEKSAQASRDFADNAAKINAGISTAVDKLNMQAGELQESVAQATRLATSTEKTAQSAREGIETNRDALLLENRAWLGVIAENVTEFEAGKVIKAEITLTNSGKTPASQVKEGVDVQGFPAIPNTPLLFGLRPTAAIPPQASHILQFTSPAVLSGIELGKIKDKSAFLVLRGIIQYEDFNKVQRQTNVCMFMSDPTTKKLSFCEAGNDMY